ncbi:MAG TPA: hypothetical protein VNL97_04670 [Solirubrobacterales bacterium]|nr:hypothetical protein [Solirubrobacterales bacterium]
MAGDSLEPPFHLRLEQDEAGVAKTALNLLISEEAHEPPIRPLAREVLGSLKGTPDEHGILSVPLTPAQMKITHTAVKLLHDDLRYEHGDERAILRRILDKLPDEHTMRAIQID